MKSNSLFSVTYKYIANHKIRIHIFDRLEILHFDYIFLKDEPHLQPEGGAPRPPARLPQKKSPLLVHVVVENRQSTGSDGGYEQIKDFGVTGISV